MRSTKNGVRRRDPPLPVVLVAAVVVVVVEVVVLAVEAVVLVVVEVVVVVEIVGVVMAALIDVVVVTLVVLALVVVVAAVVVVVAAVVVVVVAEEAAVALAAALLMRAIISRTRLTAVSGAADGSCSGAAVEPSCSGAAEERSGAAVERSGAAVERSRGVGGGRVGIDGRRPRRRIAEKLTGSGWGCGSSVRPSSPSSGSSPTTSSESPPPVLAARPLLSQVCSHLPLAELHLTGQVDVHPVRELERIHAREREDVGAGAARLARLTEVAHQFRFEETAAVVGQLKDGGARVADVLPVIGVAVCDGHVHAAGGGLRQNDHRQLVSDPDDAVHGGGERTAAQLNVHPTGDVVAGEASLSGLQRADGNRPERDQLLHPVRPVAAEPTSRVPALLDHLPVNNASTGSVGSPSPPRLPAGQQQHRIRASPTYPEISTVHGTYINRESQLS